MATLLPAAVALAAASTMAGSAASGAPQSICWPPVAAEAVAVRVLQSELTVGALACGMPEAYAAFVERQAPTLERHATVLKDFYVDRLGDDHGPRAVDALVTQLANEASTRKVSWTADYCSFMQVLTDSAARQPSGTLGGFATTQPHARRALAKGACQSGDKR